MPPKSYPSMLIRHDPVSSNTNDQLSKYLSTCSLALLRTSSHHTLMSQAPEEVLKCFL